MSAQVKDIDLLIRIARALPPARVAELVDFARFLEAQELARELAEDQMMDELEEARWDSLLRSEKGQQALEMLASEALEDHRRGKTRAIRFTPEGRMEPE